MNIEYYSLYGENSIETYVDNILRKDESENERTIFLKSICPDDVSNILDVGAGHGLLLEELNKSYTCEGIEITAAKVNFINKKLGIKATLGSAHELPFPNDSFDAVYCCEVLEHLPFEIFEQSLKEIERVSKKYIIVSVPYKETPLSTRCPYCGCIFNPNYHFRRFERETLANLFQTFKMINDYPFGKCKNFGVIPKIFREYLLPRKFTNTTLCPACNFRKKGDALKRDPEQKKSFIGRTLPKKKRWHIAIYRSH